MKKYAIFLASLLSLCGAAHAVGTITGISSTPANPVAGESAKFKIATTGAGECGMRLVYSVISGGGNEPSDNALINTHPAAGGVMDKAITKPGIYKLKAVGSPSLDPKCNGAADLIVYVVAKPAVATPPAPTGKPNTGAAPTAATSPAGTAALAGAIVMTEETLCPTPYSKFTSGVDVPKGESYCVKSAATCPDAYISNRNQQTGQLTCIPKIAVDSPDGWSRGAGDGGLVFNSIPQPMVKCPSATKDWQWGTTYYKESWNRMGCRANQKPAY